MKLESLKRLVVVVGLVGGALTGVAPHVLPVSTTALAAAIKVACIGDSITFGYNLQPDQSYPAELQRLLGSGYDVRNYGRNGATVLKQGDNPYWNMDLYQISTTFRPDIAIIMLGTNDSKPNNWDTHSGQFEPDYVDFVRHYQGLGSTVYVATPPPAQGGFSFWQVDKVVPHVRNVIQTTGARMIDVNQSMANMPQYFQDDVHPNAQGAAYLARVMYDGVRANGQSPLSPTNLRIVALAFGN